MRKKLVSLSIVLSLFVSLMGTQFAHGDTASAVTYLKTKTVNPWITMALVANGEVSPNVDYLKTTTGSNATDYEAPILALVAAGKNPKTFPNTDLVAALKTFHTGGQIGSASTLNDDIFGLLALLAAGEPGTDSAVLDAKNFILTHQNGNGGWSFAVGGDSDTNMTAMAISALIEVGFPKTDSHIVSAVNYLKNAQNTDGGFPYDPVSPWGTDSDASSTAWVVSAINKLGEDPNGSAWSKSGHSALSKLMSFQTGSGYFEYQSGTGEDSFTPVTTAYAVVAITGKYYPIGGLTTPTQVTHEVGYKIEGSTGTICEGDVDAPNALDLVKMIATTCNFTYHITETSFGPYLDKINNDEAHDLVGWMYAVNFALGSVGAADYNLQNGDYVIWHFGNFDWNPGGSGINLNANVLPAIGDNGSDNDSISFTVNVLGGGNNLGFGDVTPGSLKSQTIVITNNGTGSIYLESAVTGDEVFRNYLNLDGLSWRNFSLDLAQGATDESQVNLQIPSSYSNSGAKTGKLIFWATAN